MTSRCQHLPPRPYSLSIPWDRQGVPWPLSVTLGCRIPPCFCTPVCFLGPHLLHTRGLSFPDGFSGMVQKMPLSPAIVTKSPPFAVPGHETPLKISALPPIWWTAAPTGLDCVSDLHRLPAGPGSRVRKAHRVPGSVSRSRLCPSASAKGPACVCTNCGRNAFRRPGALGSGPTRPDRGVLKSEGPCPPFCKSHCPSL